MVYGFAKQAKPGDQISDTELEQSIRRNFSGLDDVDPVEIFSQEFPRLKRLKVINYSKRNIGQRRQVFIIFTMQYIGNVLSFSRIPRLFAFR